MTKGQWQLTTSFFHFYPDKHYIGTEPNAAINAYRGPVNVRSQFNFDLTYAITEHWNVSLDVPIQHQPYNLHRPFPASGSTGPVPINTGANGPGEMTLRGDYWLFLTKQSQGNVLVFLGLEMPTGKSDAASDVYDRQASVDISVQPGNGAWGIVPTVRAFHTFHRFALYEFATYLINPRNTTGTPAFFSALRDPNTTTVNSGRSLTANWASNGIPS